MQKSRSTLALVLFAGALSTGSAAAQSIPEDAPGSRSDLRGFMLGGSFSGGVAGMGLQGEKTNSVGFGVTLGFGVSERVTLFTRGDYAYRATYLDVGARYSFGGASSALRPYVEGALTGAATGLRTGTFGEPAEDRRIRSTAAALTAGAGVEYFLAPNLALDLGLGYSKGRWIHTGPGEARIGESGDFGTPRLNIGIRWRP